jgi:hypothetical protein
MRFALLTLLVTVAACGGESKADSTRGNVRKDSSSSRAPVTSAPAKKLTEADLMVRAGIVIDSAHPSGPRRVKPDSAILLAQASQPEHRNRADSISLVNTIRAGLKHAGWPVHGPTPLPNSILPEKRIVAFYGNPLSKRMGVLGEYPSPEMLAKLDTAVAEWTKADPGTPVQPALHLVASVAQGQPGKDSMFRQRSDPDLIEKVHGWAKSKNGILFLDIQTGKSTIPVEIEALIPFLSRPDVHLGLDPEFHMHHNRAGRTPGAKIGAMTAAEINGAIDRLAQLVTKHNLPPKVLVVHRFTKNMLQNASDIKLDPRVQVVINMDGWGAPWLKFDTYKTCEVAEPVQFTGFKLFFHNDTKKGDRLLTPTEVLALRPRPIYIQYQ